ncbi:MAG: GIY-YIG nuclease family protein [Candidatus Peribacteraceae bacterium]|nr:GIY-YIG nuclease family protein [Candidatus Peribacteraceae bacterium]
MSHFFYLARCHDGSLYSGWTTNLVARERAHNSGKGAKYTAGRRPVTIIYSEEFKTRSEALRREAAVKKLSRTQKLKLTQVKNC